MWYSAGGVYLSTVLKINERRKELGDLSNHTELATLNKAENSCHWNDLSCSLFKWKLAENVCTNFSRQLLYWISGYYAPISLNLISSNTIVILIAVSTPGTHHLSPLEIWNPKIMPDFLLSSVNEDKNIEWFLSPMECGNFCPFNLQQRTIAILTITAGMI